MKTTRAERRTKRRVPMLQVISILVAIGVGLLILVTKVGAQPAPPPATARLPAGGPFAAPPPVLPLATAPKLAPPKLPLVKVADAGAPDGGAGGAIEAAGTLDGGAANAAPNADGGSPIDYAEVQTEADFPADMSDEAKNALGTGKVPIHKEGRYRSPFAHPRFGGPAMVKAGLVLIKVAEYSIQTGTFEADFFLSLTSDKPMSDMNLNYTNGKEINQVVLADTPTFKFYRVSGTFSGTVDLRGFPFDVQHLAIAIEDQKGGVDQIVMEPDPNRTSLDEGFEVPGWSVNAISAKAYRHLYPPRFDRDDLYISRYKFVLSLERFGLSAAFSVFVPALVIVIIAISGMWVPPDELEVRSNTGAPMLAAAVLFHYSLMQALPATGYLTRADKVMLGVYLSLLINMLTTWLFLVIKEENVQRMFRSCRVVAPIAMAIVTALSAIV